MSAAFDSLAPDYHALWAGTPRGIRQRAQVWAEIDRTFPAGSRVLDLGCGAGDDALHLHARGVGVDALDSSPQMVAAACARGVAARLLPIENLAEGGPPDGFYFGVLSNFGALNCVPALEPVARSLARFLHPGAPAAVCIMGRFWLWETVRYLFRLDVRRATRRWSGRTNWRGMEIRYWSAEEIERAFRPHFRLERRVRIGGGDHQLYILRRTEC